MDIQWVAFLMHQQVSSSSRRICTTTTKTHAFWNDTMIYCISGRPNNYRKSSQSHEKIVENACERKQIEFIYDASSMYFFLRALRFPFNTIFSASVFVFFSENEKKNSFVRHKKTTKRKHHWCLCVHMKAISWFWWVNRVAWNRIKNMENWLRFIFSTSDSTVATE